MSERRTGHVAPSPRPRWLVAAAAVPVAVVGVVVWGGYAEGWAWTGLSTQVRLWDWLEGLALPVTVALLPLLLRHRERLAPRHMAGGLALLTVFAALVLAGYLVPMSWTGFTGNTLWDWLTLALLPLVLATSTLWRRPPRWTRRHIGLLVVAAVAAVALVLAGYLVPWAWTGFTGNTAWDWIKLLLLPVLLPVFVMPRLLAAAEGWLAPRAPTATGPSTLAVRAAGAGGQGSGVASDVPRTEG
jgi:hypothetical protein